METRVQRWGNSLAVRIPKAFALQAKVGNDSRLNIDFRDGELILTPLPPTENALAAILAQVTPENLPEAWEPGPPVGNEAW